MTAPRPHRSLIITTTTMFPLEQAVDGIFIRFRLFVMAVAHASEHVEILFLGPDAVIVARQHRENLSELLSAHWGIAVTARFVQSRPRPRGLYHEYVSGIGSAAAQPSIVHYTGTAQLAAVAAALDTTPDLVLVFGLPAMVAVLATDRRPGNLFFDLNDVEHRLRIRTALQPPVWPGKLAGLTQVPALLRAERRAAALARAMFVCSQVDLAYLGRMGFPGTVRMVPNAVTLPLHPPGLAPAPTLLFLGGYSYAPNRSAAERLITLIWPLIRARRPDARLIVAGKSAELIPSFAAKPDGVEFAGFVADLEALYARARVIACPITAGSGTRLKLLEAAAYGKPMVSTTIGAEGLAFRDGNEILIRDDDAGFAEACLALFDDDALAARLGCAARGVVAETYDIDVIARQVFAGQVFT